MRWRKDRPTTVPYPLWGEPTPAAPCPRTEDQSPLPRRVWLQDLEEDAVPVMVASLRGLLGRFYVTVPDSVLHEQVYAMLEYAGIVVPGGTLEALLYGKDPADAE